MQILRYGFMTAALSAGMMLGGSALAQTAQNPNMSPSATQPSPTSQDGTSRPMSEQPTVDNSRQDQQGSGGVSNQTSPRNENDTDARRSSSSDRDPLSAKGDSDTTQKDVKEFDNFLDKHPAVAQDLRNDPSKVNDTAFLSSHKELQKWLEKHPQVRSEISENPSAFMHRENRYEKNEKK